MVDITNSRILRAILLLLAVCLVSLPAQAAVGVSTYIFLSDQSTVLQTGGIAGVHWTYSIEGKFQLSVDPIAPNAGVASFIYVDANAADDSPYRRTLDPNEVFNMTGLVGTVLSDMMIAFTGKAGDGSDILIIAILKDDLVYLVGQTFPPAGSADFFIFSLDAVAQRKYDGGSGTTNDPYLIYTAKQMNSIGTEPNDWDKHFKLMADIDLSEYTGTSFNIIGYWRSRSDNKPFSGIFDGNSKIISNFTYTSVNASKVGLFGYLDGENAHIKDLGLYNPNVTAGIGRYVGALVSDTNGYITSCYVKGGSVSGNHIVGGLTGSNRGTLSNCTSSCIVSGTGLVVGGLAGGNSGIITDCCSTGNVSAGGYVGGLVGTNDGMITDCYATGNMWGNNGVGGFVGHNDYYANIARCYSTGGVSGDSALGGLAGSNSGRITNCYSAGSVSGDEWIGGLVGINGSYFGEAFGTITNCYSVGIVSSHTTVGGLLGFNYGTVTASFWDIETTGLIKMCGRQIWGIGCENADGKTTAEMQTAATFLEAGWDFVGETANGTEDIWWILEGKDYPRLWWERSEIRNSNIEIRNKSK